MKSSGQNPLNLYNSVPTVTHLLRRGENTFLLFHIKDVSLRPRAGWDPCLHYGSILHFLESKTEQLSLADSGDVVHVGLGIRAAIWQTIAFNRDHILISQTLPSNCLFRANVLIPHPPVYRHSYLLFDCLRLLFLNRLFLSCLELILDLLAPYFDLLNNFL